MIRIHNFLTTSDIDRTGHLCYNIKKSKEEHKVKKQLLAFLLLVSLLSSISCGDAATPDETTAQTPDGTETTAEETISDNLPDADFGGYEFRLFVPENSKDSYTPESETGEIVDDAIYRRNRTVEERFKIKLTSVSSGKTNSDEHLAEIRKLIEAGEDAADMVLGTGKKLSTLALEGYFLNIRDIEHLDFTKPWWSSGLVDDLTFNGKMFTCSNNLSYDEFAGSKVYFFNKQLIENYRLDNPYDLVFDGKWTLDRLISMTKDTYEDLNGNGSPDENDRYGMLTTISHNAWSVALGIPEWQKNKDTIDIVAMSNRMLEAFDKIHDWYFNSKGLRTYSSGKDENMQEIRKIFGEGRAVFSFGFIGWSGSEYRDSDVDYGIIPYPKFDETQENYRVFLGVNSINMFSIPITVTNTDRTGVILEALSAEGYRQVIPTYYEIALKDKYLRDEESVQMLDLITASRTISFSYMYDNYGKSGLGFGNCFTSSYKDSYATFYAAQENAVKSRIADVLKAFTE